MRLTKYLHKQIFKGGRVVKLTNGKYAIVGGNDSECCEELWEELNYYVYYFKEGEITEKSSQKNVQEFYNNNINQEELKKRYDMIHHKDIEYFTNICIEFY